MARLRTLHFPSRELSFSLLFIRRLDLTHRRNDSTRQYDQSTDISLADVVGSGRDRRLSHIVSPDVGLVLCNISASKANQAKLLPSKQSLLRRRLYFTGMTEMNRREHLLFSHRTYRDQLYKILCERLLKDSIIRGTTRGRKRISSLSWSFFAEWTSEREPGRTVRVVFRLVCMS